MSTTLCLLVGCRWENRTGYDWCPRCEQVSWHVARPPRRRLRPLSRAAAVLTFPFGALGWLAGHEGSELFADRPA